MDGTLAGRELDEDRVPSREIGMSGSVLTANAWVLRTIAFLMILTVVAVVVPKPKGPFRVSPTAVTLHAMSSFLLVGAVAALVLVGLSADREALIWRPLASLVAAIAVTCYETFRVPTIDWILLAAGWSAGAIAVAITRRLRLDHRLAPAARVLLAQPAACCVVLAVVVQGWGEWGMDSYLIGFPLSFLDSGVGLAGPVAVWPLELLINIAVATCLLLAGYGLLHWLRRWRDAPWSDELLRDGRAAVIAGAGIAALGATITTLRLRSWIRGPFSGLGSDDLNLLTIANPPILIALALSALLLAAASRAQRAGARRSAGGWALAAWVGLAPALILGTVDLVIVATPLEPGDAAAIHSWPAFSNVPTLGVAVALLSLAGLGVIMRSRAVAEPSVAPSPPSQARWLGSLAIVHALVAASLAVITLTHVAQVVLRRRG